MEFCGVKVMDTPTDAQLLAAYDFLVSVHGGRGLPGWLTESAEGWLTYFKRRDQAVVVFNLEGVSAVVVWLTDYCSDSGSVQVHFAASGWRAVRLFRAVDAWLEYLLEHRVYRVLFGFFRWCNGRAVRTAGALGFVEFARVEEWVYFRRVRRGDS